MIDKDLTEAITQAAVAVGCDPALALADDQVIALADRLLVNHQGSVSLAARGLRVRVAQLKQPVTNPQPAAEPSTYFNQAQKDLELDHRHSRQGVYRVGSEETVRPPLVGNDWAKADSAIEPPLGYEPGDLHGPQMNIALGGASEAPASRQCWYFVDGACLLITQGIGPCLCDGGAQ